MNSPFPGMDPYLERHWLDVHGRLVTYAADALNERLPDDLVARTEERLAVETPESSEAHQYRPDVRVASPGLSEPDAQGATIEAPFKLVVDLEPVTEKYLKVIHPEDERLVTVIEFLSPSNKRGEGLKEYTAKRNELLAAGVNVVEIDLVRAGDWRKLLRPHLCPREAAATYRTVVRSWGERKAAFIYPMPLDKPLPSVIVPLRNGDPRVMLDLQPLIDHAYVRGRYGRTIDYAQDCDPPLEAAEAQFAATVKPR
jgi:hypothetical protein